MDLCFSKRELSWLDDLMPESKKKKLDDAKKKAKEEEIDYSQDGRGINIIGDENETRQFYGTEIENQTENP